MSDSIFEEGGPHQVKRTGKDRFSMSITLPKDQDGMIGRECPSSTCEPAYFKIKPGTGVKGQDFAFCPYCSQKDDEQNFHTAEQKKYAEDIVMRQARLGINKVLRDNFELDSNDQRTIDGGIVSLKISLDAHTPPVVPRPIEEELRRNLTCSQCGLEHAVFGLAVWCPDCGVDIFLTHVDGEFEVIRRMIGDISSRRERLGARIAAKDTENALEDVVSTFEAVLRHITRMSLRKSGKAPQEVDELMTKQIGNKYQNIEMTSLVFKEQLGLSFFDSLTTNELDFLKLTFEKRHPITHNLGIVDRKYLLKVRGGELQGREIRVKPAEILESINLCTRCINSVYPKLIG